MSLIWTGTFVKLTIILTGIAVGYLRKNYLTEANRIFWVYLIVALAGEVLDVLLARYLGNNFPYYHVFKPLYYALITLGLAEEVKGTVRKVFLAFIPFIIIAAIVNGKYFQPPDKKLNSFIIIFTSTLLTIQVLFYIAWLFEKHDWHGTIYHHSFWIALGVMIFAITSFLGLGIYNVTGQSNEILLNILVYSEWLYYFSFIVNFALQRSQPET